VAAPKRGARRINEGRGRCRATSKETAAMTKHARPLAALLLAGAVAGATPALAQDSEEFVLGFAIDSMVQQIPYHVAREHGYFEDEGLDVEFQYFDGSSALVQQIVAGNVDAGSPAVGSLFNAVVQGHPLKQVFSFQYKSVFTLATPEGAGIDDVSDLAGKAVGVSELSGGEVPIVRAIIREAGLTEGEDVQIVPVGDGSALTVNALQSGQVQAYSSNMFDIAAIRAAGIPMDIIMPASVENFPGNGLVVMESTLEEKRTELEGLTRALARALVYVENNRDEAFELARELAPEEMENLELANASFDAAYTLRERPADMGDAPIGTHYLPGIEAYHDFMRQGSEEEGALMQDIDLDALLDESLLPAANDFDKAAAALPRAEQQ
jgi:ABC-type nitrate/sulfonate/bicarbonate transport system substrate-binding protein